MAPVGFSPAILHRLHPCATSSTAAFRIPPSSSSFSSSASDSVRCSHAMDPCWKFEPQSNRGLGFKAHNASCDHGIGASDFCWKFKAQADRVLGFRVHNPSFSLEIGASGSFWKLEAQLGQGLGFRVHNVRRVMRACLGPIEQDSVNFGVVLPARQEVYMEAVRALGNGHVVAVSTDTLYGLACDASSTEAIQRVYEIKERKLNSPLAVCVADVDVVGAFCEPHP